MVDRINRMLKSVKFEKQISRIHEVLVQDSTEVVWNDKVPDPDNPQQLRQIDITLKRGCDITHIECRSHKVPQGTKWIEELYGRKISLHATSMIAVSDSGFTEGAIRKAKRFGIFLCNLNELTEQEVKTWEKKTKIRFYYYVFSNISVWYYLNSIEGLNKSGAGKDFFSKPEYIDAIFNDIKYQFNNDKKAIFPYCFGFWFNGECAKILGRKVLKVFLRGEVDKAFYDVECSSISHYSVLSEEQSSTSLHLASIEKSEEENIEIIKSAQVLSSISLDISSAPQAPSNSIFAGSVTFQSIPVRIGKSPKFSVIGSPEQKIYLSEGSFQIAEFA